MAPKQLFIPFSTHAKPPTSIAFPRRHSRVKIASFFALLDNARTLLSTLIRLFDELSRARDVVLQLISSGDRSIAAYRAAFSAYDQEVGDLFRNHQALHIGRSAKKAGCTISELHRLGILGISDWNEGEESRCTRTNELILKNERTRKAPLVRLMLALSDSTLELMQEDAPIARSETQLLFTSVEF